MVSPERLLPASSIVGLVLLLVGDGVIDVVGFCFVALPVVIGAVSAARR